MTCFFLVSTLKGVLVEKWVFEETSQVLEGDLNYSFFRGVSLYLCDPSVRIEYFA